MTKISTWAVAACALALALAAGPASASSWLVSYAADSGAPADANLTVTVDDAFNATGFHNVLHVTGDVDGDLVTGLITNPVQPNVATSADGLFWYDNTFQGPAPSFSWYGLLFSSATHEYNLFSDSPTRFELYKSDFHGYVANSVGSLTVSPAAVVETLQSRAGAIPEPASWALLIMGFGALGSALRAKRKYYREARA